MLEALARIGPFMSGIGLIAGAVIAAISLTKFNLRHGQKQRDDAWLTTFGNLFEKFWYDPDVSSIRKCVSNDQAYSTILPALARRNAMPVDSNTLDVKENELIDQVDKFCFAILRIMYFSKLATETGLESSQTTFNEYWMRKIRKREELAQYMRRFWTDIGA